MNYHYSLVWILEANFNDLSFFTQTGKRTPSILVIDPKDNMDENFIGNVKA
jgi:hypothetical protein